MRLVLLATFLVAGCTSTRAIDATSPSELAVASAVVVGRTADVMLVSGDRYRGTVRFLRPDSTAWTSAEALFAVPTADVQALVVNRRRRALGRGALIGGGGAFALCTLGGALVTSGIDESGVGDTNEVLLIGALCTPIGVAIGVGVGAISGGRTEIALRGPAAAAGPSE